jgi:hypothetical protein
MNAGRVCARVGGFPITGFALIWQDILPGALVQLVPGPLCLHEACHARGLFGKRGQGRGERGSRPYPTNP